ncbi:MAG: hypothetical protein JXN59_02870 [Anaerolineae bacterium]|nr:hypothetical protein [Anaerolineae bacterium]
MHDLLELINTHQDTIANVWSRLARDEPRYPAIQMDAAARAALFQGCARALLTLMQTGDTTPLQEMLETITYRRIAAGTPLAETLAIWLLYRQAVQQALSTALISPGEWDQLVDRVDSALSWGTGVIRAAYNTADEQ